MLLAIGIVVLVGLGAAVAVIASGDDGSDDTGDDTGSVDEAVTGTCTGELDVLSAADIQDAVGVPVAEGLREERSQFAQDDQTTCDFDVGDSTLVVIIERSEDPAASIDMERDLNIELDLEVVDVSGVGDEAIYEPFGDLLLARSGDILVRFFYSGTDEAFTVEAFSLLAQTVFERTGVA